MLRFTTTIAAILLIGTSLKADTCTFCQPVSYSYPVVSHPVKAHQVTVINQQLPLTTPKPKQNNLHDQQIDYALLMQQQLLKEAFDQEQKTKIPLRTFSFQRNIQSYTPRPLQVQQVQPQRGGYTQKMFYANLQQSFAIKNGKVLLNLPIHDPHGQTRIYNPNGRPFNSQGPVFISSKTITFTK